MKIDIARYLPAGLSWDEERPYLKWSLLTSSLWSLTYFGRYFRAYHALFYLHQISYNKTERRLRPGAVMAPFQELMVGTPLTLFGIYFFALLILGGFHYLYHRKGSMSIYLMKRLPNRWELHRRCWGVPLLGAAAGLLLMTALMLLYYLFYCCVTPDVCRP